MDTSLPAKAHRPLHLSDVTPIGQSLGNHHSDKHPDPAFVVALFAIAMPLIIFSIVRRLIQRAFGISKSRARVATLLFFMFGGMGRN